MRKLLNNIGEEEVKEIFSIIFIAIFLSFTARGCAPDYSEGSRVGIITKLSHKGIFFKSWEGELLMGGLRRHENGDGTTSMTANVFAFNVDPAVVGRVIEAQRAGRPVELVYRQWYFKPMTIEHSHVVIEVRNPPQ